ncbi:hypothetical protein OESDEN_24091, partial [Oesophagostomum dentatum]
MRNCYSRADSGDDDSITLPQPSNTTPIRLSSSSWVNKTRDEILCDLFLEKDIDLRFSQKLGSGRYSKVITGQIASTGEPVAIKMINTQKVTEEFRCKFLPREIECWKRLNHPHLVRILGHYEAMQHVFLTMEFASGGDM